MLGTGSLLSRTDFPELRGRRHSKGIWRAERGEPGAVGSVATRSLSLPWQGARAACTHFSSIICFWYSSYSSRLIPWAAAGSDAPPSSFFSSDPPPSPKFFTWLLIIVFIRKAIVSALRERKPNTPRKLKTTNKSPNLQVFSVIATRWKGEDSAQPHLFKGIKIARSGLWALSWIKEVKSLAERQMAPITKACNQMEPTTFWISTLS